MNAHMHNAHSIFNKRTIVFVFVLLGILLISVGWRPFLSKNEPLEDYKPNVILIVIDTLRTDHVGCYGYNTHTTPNIDRFSRTASCFYNAVSASSWTTPSVATMFTSLYPREVCPVFPPVPLPQKTLTLPELFKNNGYRTAGIISGLLLKGRLGFNQGFDTYDEENAQGQNHISSPSVTRKGLNFLQNLGPEPFFLFLHYFDPHFAFKMHPPFLDGTDYDGPVHSGIEIGKLWEMAPKLTTKDLTYLRALYDSEIRFTDGQIGKFLQAVSSKALVDNTMICIVADHGEEFSERGKHYIGHGRHLHKELIDVPLLLRLPGQNKHIAVNNHISLIDLWPTLAHHSRIKVPQTNEMRGKPWFGPSAHIEESRVIFSDTVISKIAMIKDEWKLFRDLSKDGSPHYKLFNLNNDPGEKFNVAKQNSEILKELSAELEEWAKVVKRTEHKFEPEAATAHFSEEEGEKLRALGYMY